MIEMERIDHIRRRPGMYIGGVDLRALHNLIEEVIGNSINEAHVGYCTRIEVILRHDGFISIRDNGSGIPVDLYRETGLSILELILTRPGNTGMFDRKTSTFYPTLFGVGLNVVNGQSEELKAEVCRDGYLWEQDYRQGRRQSDLQQVRKQKTPRIRRYDDYVQTRLYYFRAVRTELRNLGRMSKRTGISHTQRNYLLA
jgi:DNA gyrase subunit B